MVIILNKVLILVTAFTFISCAKVNYVPVNSVKTNYVVSYLHYMDFVKLEANISPENASFKNILWSSSDNSVATVDMNGLVYARSIGECDITAITLDGLHTYSCRIIVTVE